MKTQVEVELPINKAFDLFLDKSTYKEWKKDFVSYEPVSGTPGEVGAVTNLVYKDYVMVETIVSKRDHCAYSATYEHIRGGRSMVFHIAQNQFTVLSPHRTLIEVDGEITRVNGFMMKLMMKLMAGAGQKQAQEQLNKFKAVFEEKVVE